MAYDLFLHNWVEGATVRTGWSTDITYSTETLDEQRLALLTHRPARQIEVRWLAWDRHMALRLLTMLQQASDQEQRIPLYPDQAITTSSSSGTTINCPTDYRRFGVGSLVVIHQRGQDGMATNIQFGTVSVIGAGSLTLESALSGSYPTGSYVYPVMRCHKLLDARMTAHTDGVATVQAEFDEVLAEDALPASTDEVEDQVLNFGPNWGETVEIGMVRVGRQEVLGRSQEVDPQGTRPSMTFSFTLTEFSKEDFWDILSLFDGCRGRLLPLWLVNPMVLFSPVAVAANSVDVEVPTGGTLADVEDYVRYVALNDEIKTVTGITLQAGPVWRIAFTEATALTLGDLDTVTLAHLVRFSEDELEEEWFTDEVFQVRLSFQECPSGEATSFGTSAVFADCGVTE